MFRHFYCSECQLLRPDVIGVSPTTKTGSAVMLRGLVGVQSVSVSPQLMFYGRISSSAQCEMILLTQASSDRCGNGDGALKKRWTEMGARWFLIGFDRRGQIARLSEFFWTRDWNPPLFGLDPLQRRHIGVLINIKRNP
eukprot:scaffold12139_cov60-Cyclotella_meneghiniana.AAC.2